MSYVFPKQVANLVSQHHSISNHWLNNERRVALPWVLQQVSMQTAQTWPNSTAFIHLSMENKEEIWLKGESTIQMSPVSLLLLAPWVSNLHRLPVIQYPFPEQE